MPTTLKNTGIETQEQLNYIRSLGCDVIQGYFFAKPEQIDKIMSVEFKNKMNGLLVSLPSDG